MSVMAKCWISHQSLLIYSPPPLVVLVRPGTRPSRLSASPHAILTMHLWFLHSGILAFCFVHRSSCGTNIYTVQKITHNIYYIMKVYIILSWYITVWRLKMRVAIRCTHGQTTQSKHWSSFPTAPQLFTLLCTPPKISQPPRIYIICIQQWSTDDGWERQQRYLLNLLFQVVQQRPKEGFENS